MCYPQPGPRCYTHARVKLNNAHSRVARAKEVESEGQQGKERMRKALENLAQAQSEYDTTNEGMTELAFLYKDEERTAVKDKYRHRLTLAKKLRERQDAWAKEYNTQKRTKRKAPTQKMKDIEKSIKVVDEESTPFYKANHYSTVEESAPVVPVVSKDNPVEETETISPAVSAVEEETPSQEIRVSRYEKKKVDIPVENPNIAKLNVSKQREEDTKKRADVTPVKSLDSLDLSRPQVKRRKISPRVRDTGVSQVEPVKISSIPTQKSAVEKLNDQNGYHSFPVLYDNRQKEMTANVVSLPHGKRVWEITDSNGSTRRVPMASSSNAQARSRYYAQFGITEKMITVPGRVAYSPQENGFVVKAA